MKVPPSVLSVMVEGTTYFAGAEIPDELLSRHPELLAQDHPLQAPNPDTAKEAE